MKKEEFRSRYKCSSCNKVSDSLRWEVHEKYKIGFCECGQEVSRKLKD
jgi:hypothetical protein